MRCERCDREGFEGDLFCRACGGKLVAGAPSCSACGRPGVRDDVFCVHCGAALMPDEPPPAVLVESRQFGEPVPFVVRVVGGEGLDAYGAPRDGLPVDRRLDPSCTLILRRCMEGWAFVWADDGWMGWVREAGLVNPDDPEGRFVREDEPESSSGLL